MRSKKIKLSNFSRAQHSNSFCLRPDNEEQLQDELPNPILARGAGLSYNDSCFNSDAFLIDTSRLNHLISFDKNTGIAVCQGATLLKDLFLLNPDFIPPVIPGTLHATVAGCLAHDVHGKNNHQEGSFGRHVIWFDLLINGKTIRCSRTLESKLYYATIGGLGLTGIITRIAIQMKKTSRFITVEHSQHTSLSELLKQMTSNGLKHDYQVAWIDLLNIPNQAILSLANHCEAGALTPKSPHKIPKIPFGIIKKWNMKIFNKLYFHSKKAKENISLEQFNNPLDSIMNWNRLYGPKGLIQFQAVFPEIHAEQTIGHLKQIIAAQHATPTLAVLKLFTQSGDGLFSFCKPGFTLAIDFVRNAEAIVAIKAMNEYMVSISGSVYLAKDQLLTAEQFEKMYTNKDTFIQLINDYGSPMQSDLAKRLRIIQ